ncbi:TPA: HNH endonuclease, partial [Listeria monocytogenes]|nr:HNH endonuclease [Listeria monocytogenes]
SQKGGYFFEDILTEEILTDVCRKVTGTSEYTVEFDNEGGYNKGRLATISYKGSKIYVSFSQAGKVEGRNYNFQSLTTALVRFYRGSRHSSRICFYFLPQEGNRETEYFSFMYRVMATAGVEFINDEQYLTQTIEKFANVQDIINARDRLREGKRNNNSSYLTKSEYGVAEIYAKTYGANKKEAVLISLAASHISKKIRIYEIREQNISVLPKPDKEALEMLPNVEIINTDMQIEIREFVGRNSLRSPRYIFNLLDRLGPKKCTLCDCEIPELIEGAHIWPVADIKADKSIPNDQKLNYAIDGHNGIWLCENHHKMFDEGLIRIEHDGTIRLKDDLNDNDKSFIITTTTNTLLPDGVISEEAEIYLAKRDEASTYEASNYITI